MQRGLATILVGFALLAGFVGSVQASTFVPASGSATVQVAAGYRACLSCGHVSDAKFKFCGICGRRFTSAAPSTSPAVWNCNKCKSANPSKYLFCGTCGRSRQSNHIQPASSSKNSKSASAVTSSYAPSVCRGCGNKQYPNISTNTYCTRCGRLMAVRPVRQLATRTTTQRLDRYIAKPSIYCTQCGAKSPAGAKYCIQCGRKRV